MPAQLTSHREGAHPTDQPLRSSRVSGAVVGSVAAATIQAMERYSSVVGVPPRRQPIGYVPHVGRVLGSSLTLPLRLMSPLTFSSCALDTKQAATLSV